MILRLWVEYVFYAVLSFLPGLYCVIMKILLKNCRPCKSCDDIEQSQCCEVNYDVYSERSVGINVDLDKE